MNPQSESQNADATARGKISLPPIRLFLSSPTHMLYPGRTADPSGTPVGDADRDHNGAKISLPPMRLYPSRPEDLIYPGRNVDLPQVGVSPSRDDRSRHESERYKGTRDVPGEGHHYVRHSDNGSRPAISVNPGNAGGMASGVAGPNVSARGGTMGHRGPSVYVQPDARSFTFTSTPTAGNTGRVMGTSNNLKIIPHRSQGQNDGPRPHGHPRPPVAPDRRPKPTSIAPGPLPRAQRFQIPLPADTDPDFKIDIIVSGGIGFHLTWERTDMTELHVMPGVAKVVENATTTLDDIIVHDYLYVHRVYYASENTRAKLTRKYINPMRNYTFTLGHLISLLQTMQYNHWTSSSMKENRTLQYVVGMDSGLPQGGPVLQFSDLCVTAIRRRWIGHERMWCYIMQLEVRIP
ncbi:hypothetical protein C8Q70DRAFT_1030332 [Cubamyces menziesii]|nr:hypothetical protein C8Q70DRAFT_1030332 [Cubamyces menziesii]